jgi:hypothetical protein
MRQNIIEFESGEYFYVERQGNKLIAGSACNWGIIPEYEIEYDIDQSYEANLQNLVDVIQQEIYSKNA